jgi:hypothetical protein
MNGIDPEKMTDSLNTRPGDPRFIPKKTKKREMILLSRIAKEITPVFVTL